MKQLTFPYEFARSCPRDENEISRTPCVYVQAGTLVRNDLIYDLLGAKEENSNTRSKRSLEIRSPRQPVRRVRSPRYPLEVTRGREEHPICTPTHAHNALCINIYVPNYTRVYVRGVEGKKVERPGREIKRLEGSSLSSTFSFRVFFLPPLPLASPYPFPFPPSVFSSSRISFASLSRARVRGFPGWRTRSLAATY